MGNSISDFSTQTDIDANKERWLKRYDVLAEKLRERRARLSYPKYPLHRPEDISPGGRERSTVIEVKVSSFFTGGYTLVEALMVTEHGLAWEETVYLNETYDRVLRENPDGFSVRVNTN